MNQRALAFGSALLLATLGCLGAAEAEEETPPSSENGGEEDTSEFDATVAQAVAHYQAQRYDQAVEMFQRAYAMRPQPELIYNIARVYERAVRPRAALEQYERFLSLPNTTSDLRARAATSIEALRTEIAAQERAQNPPTTSGGTDSTTTTPPTPPVPPVEEGPSNAGAVAGWLLVGLGAATLATGVIMGGLALSEQTATEEATSLVDQTDHFDRGTSYALAADILFGAGGALAIAGMVILIVRATRNNADDEDGAEEGETSSLLFTPSFSANGGLGLTLGGRF